MKLSRKARRNASGIDPTEPPSTAITYSGTNWHMLMPTSTRLRTPKYDTWKTKAHNDVSASVRRLRQMERKESK